MLSLADADNGVLQNVRTFRNTTVKLTLTMPERLNNPNNPCSEGSGDHRISVASKEEEDV